VLGWGARWLRFAMSADAAYRRQCDQAMNYVPLLSMTLAAVTLVLLFVAPDGRAGMQALILVCCLLVLLLAALRQTIVVSLLNRLRTAEAAVLRNEEQLYRVAHFDASPACPTAATLKTRWSAPWPKRHATRTAPIAASRCC